MRCPAEMPEHVPPLSTPPDTNGAAVDPSLPITVLLNEASGRDDKQSVRQSIERALREAGRDFRLMTVPTRAALPELARRCAEEAIGRSRLLLAAGGDGTINAVAGHLLHTGVPLGIVPLGTFNYLARDLGIPLDPAAAVRVLLDGLERDVPVARVNGRLFFVNANFGLYRRLQEEGERRKRRFGRNRPVVVFSALLTLLRHHRVYDVQLEIDGRPVRMRTPLVFCGFNTLQLEKLGLPAAECTARGMLAVLTLRPMSRRELLGFALRGALQGLGEASNLRTYCASSVEVHWRGARTARVAIDGETCTCSLPLRFDVARDALRVIVPRFPEPRE